MKCIGHRRSPIRALTDWRLRKTMQCPSYFELKASFFYTNQKLSKYHHQNLQVTETNINYVQIFILNNANQIL